MHTFDWSFGLAKESEIAIAKIIRELSETYLDGSVFIPHITFYGVTSLQEQEKRKLISRLSAGVQPFKARLESIGYENKISKTLFINVELTAEMQEIYDMLNQREGQNFDFQPHLSLIYKQDLPTNERQKQVKFIKYPEQITVDSIILVNAEDNGSDAVNFRDWEIERYRFV